MSAPKDYHATHAETDASGEVIGYPTNEHRLFATILANTQLDAELGFITGAGELEVLHQLSLDMATRSPVGKGWEQLGYRVFEIIEAQRVGEMDAELAEMFYRARAALADDALPHVVAAEVLQQNPAQGVWCDADGRLHGELDPGDEVTEGEDQPTEEGGYVWHTDGRGPEPVA